MNVIDAAQAGDFGRQRTDDMRLHRIGEHEVGLCPLERSRQANRDRQAIEDGVEREPAALGVGDPIGHLHDSDGRKLTADRCCELAVFEEEPFYVDARWQSIDELEQRMLGARGLATLLADDRQSHL